jgi:choline dehydrogenase-like flavoprotein
MNYLDAGAHKFSAIDIFDDHRPTFPGVFDDGDIITDAVERYSLPTDFGRRYGQRLEHSKNVMVLGGVQLLRLNRDSGSGNITGLACALSDGKTPFTLEADQVIMAVGGIETPRILLASDPDRGGIGNDLGLVGRYYTCHVEKIHGLVRSKKPGLVFDFEKTRDGVYARRKILIKESVQRQHKLMNISFRLHYPDISQPEHRSSVLSAVYLAKRTLIPEYRRILQHSSDDAPMPSMEAHLRNVALGMPELMGFGVKWLRERVLAERKLPYVLVPNADQSFPIEFNAEQIPLWDSRVLLGDKLDEFGVPQVHVHWQMCEQDIDSICRSYRILRDALNATGACSVEFDDERLFDDLSRSFPVGGHHVGTTRMGASSEHGVVNGDCQVFGVPNLYIASSSVFPTSSHANPTLTIVALSLRLAGFLKHKLTH